jgi:hypothetical protein
MKILSYLICILCIIIYDNANAQSNYKYHKVLNSVTSKKINITSSYIVCFNSTNYVKYNNEIHQLNLIETYTYKKNDRPELKIEFQSSNYAMSLKNDDVFNSNITDLSVNPDFKYAVTKSPATVVTAGTLASFNNYFTSAGPLIMYLGNETYSKRDIRNQFIEDKNLYGKCLIRNFFVFANYSPSYGYKTLKSHETNNAETYDEFRKIDSVNLIKKALRSLNVGIGFSFYNGHSIALSWQHLPISKFDAIFLVDTNKIKRNVFYVGYRYQKPHSTGLIKPIWEMSLGYGQLNNQNTKDYLPTRHTFYLKNSLGASIMLSKNVYINLGPYYLRRLDKYIVGDGNGSNNKLNIKAIDHFWGIDVGMVYKFWEI